QSGEVGEGRGLAVGRRRKRIAYSAGHVRPEGEIGSGRSGVRRVGSAWFSFVAPFGLRLEGVARLNADELEANQPVALVAVVVAADGQLATDEDAGGQRLFELVEGGHADLDEVAFRHWQRGRGKPEVVPGVAPLVLSFGHFEC